MEKRVRQFIQRNQLIRKGDRIVIGVSGGADSVCLLAMLSGCRDLFEIQLFVVHIHHGIRGEDADSDEAYVKELCDKFGLYFCAYHRDIIEEAKKAGISLEEAGRKARYEIFLEECKKNHCNKVAVAHHMNDTAETVLFHLVRGSGIKGLTGIPIRRKMTEEIELIRPLLCVEKREIETYLEQHQIHYCIDATNFESDYSRNKLRNQVLPYLKEEINDGAGAHIVNAASQLSEINEYINFNIEQAYQIYVSKTEEPRELQLRKDVVKEHPVIVKGMIRKILSSLLEDGLKDVEATHIDLIQQLLQKQVGKRINLPNGLLCYGKYDVILFTFLQPSENKIKSGVVPRRIDPYSQTEYELNEIGKTLTINVIEYKKNMILPKNPYTKWFDYDKIKNTIFIRTREAGDYLQIRPDGGRKKLKDYFIDQKIPKQERDSCLLLADGNHIMWVLGDRTSEAYRVNANTKRILVIRLVGGNENGYQR